MFTKNIVCLFELSILVISWKYSSTVNTDTDVFLSFGNNGTNASLPCPSKCVCSRDNVNIRVDCSGKNLTSVPQNFDRYTTHLDLSMNNITTIPKETFNKLQYLRELRLVSNNIQELPVRLLQNNKLLQVLCLQGNRFNKIPSDTIKNLRNLKQLHLDANKIEFIAPDSFRNMVSLKHVYLNANRLTSVPVEALQYTSSLEALTLAANRIKIVPNNSFKNLSGLVVLLLHDNQIETIEDFAFRGLNSLKILEMNKNELVRLPPAFSVLSSLTELNIEDNLIEYLPGNSFSSNQLLTVLCLKRNPILSVHRNAFLGLPMLKKLTISEARDMTEFPDVSMSASLEILRFDRASINKIPSYICHNLLRLKSFDVHSNRIAVIPDLSACKEALNINLGNNEITSLEGKPFKGLTELRDLTLGHNYIDYIPEDAFEGLINLQYLDLVHNRITEIHYNAFLPLSSLEDLNLGENEFKTLPTNGLQNVLELKTYHNTQLKEFPRKEYFPKIQSLTLSYAYHCCDFLQAPTGTNKKIDFEEDIVWLTKGETNMEMWSKFENLSTFWKTHLDNTSVGVQVWDNFGSYDYNFADLSLPPEAQNYLEDYKPRDYTHDLVMAKPPITCEPKPGPFMPCDDLFGWWSLRCGVWFVFLLAMLGNGVVLFVSITSRSKMDVPRFLICNLACADFFMGIYLGFLAVVDASTLGEFRKHAIWWQLSPGCLIAGFVGVFSSELSVFTLTVITIERFYAITHAMQLNKRLSLRHAGYVMSLGWLYSIILASLPLFGISDYRKFAVCLPFEITDVLSKAYVCYIMIFNGLCFFTILACYLIMYLSIRQSQAWNSGDTRVAKRMALLVFTDFLCWAPIALLSLASAFGKNLIHLNEAKVLTIFVLPLNSCANPFLYAIFTKQFKKDCVSLCRRLEDSSIGRHFSRASQRHVSFTWGSSRRPSGLNSLVPCEKPGSCNSASSNGGNYNYNGDFRQSWNRQNDQNDCEDRHRDGCYSSLLPIDTTGKTCHSKYTCKDPKCRAIDSYIIIHKEFSSPKKKKVVEEVYSTSDTYVKTDSGADDVKRTKVKTKQTRGDRKRKSHDHKRKHEMVLPVVSFHGNKEKINMQSENSKKNKCVIPCCSAHSSPTDSHKCCDYQIVSAYMGKNGVIIPKDIKCLIHGDTITSMPSTRIPNDVDNSKPVAQSEIQQLPKHSEPNESDLLNDNVVAIEKDEVAQKRTSNNTVPICMREFLPGEPPTIGKLGREKIDKKAQMNFFTQSLAEHEFVQNAVCRSNSLVELAQHQLADLYNNPNKRFSLTPRQEGYILLNDGSSDSAYIDDDRRDPDEDNLSNISDLHSSDTCKSDGIEVVFEPAACDKSKDKLCFTSSRRQTKKDSGSIEENCMLLPNDNQDKLLAKTSPEHIAKLGSMKMVSSDLESVTLPSNPSCDKESGFISET